jgi:hypothetical protein
MTQNIGDPAALRLCRLLEKAGYLLHPILRKDVLGVSKDVPQLGWILTEEFEQNGCLFDAEQLAGRSA